MRSLRDFDTFSKCNKIGAIAQPFSFRGNFGGKKAKGEKDVKQRKDLFFILYCLRFMKKQWITLCIEWLLNHKLRNSNENRKIFWVDFVEIIIIAVCSDLPLISLSLLQKEYDEC